MLEEAPAGRAPLVGGPGLTAAQALQPAETSAFSRLSYKALLEHGWAHLLQRLAHHPHYTTLHLTSSRCTPRGHSSGARVRRVASRLLLSSLSICLPPPCASQRAEGPLHQPPPHAPQLLLRWKGIAALQQLPRTRTPCSSLKKAGNWILPLVAAHASKTETSGHENKPEVRCCEF